MPILNDIKLIYALGFLQRDGKYLIINTVDASEQGSLINFIDLSDAQKKRVLSWRNHASVRYWMYQPELITLAEHLDFINSLASRQDKQYLMLATEQEELGVIDFLAIDAQQTSCSFGLYANPEIQRRGVGSQLMSIAIAYAQSILKIQLIKLEAFADNTRALKLYERFNFVVTEDKIVNHKKVLCMQLNILTSK
ncbi:MAG: UDP-4-amino-4,6-dideoxy-N-acetyl-beta-L-altrosamine N-acetyltransferase [Methyloprofundus sp.]|nr:MAG: UDP-4-amino-4,6-dideoxy-N-acetyl-beta-L-altrosamine N-acetyltransferase [Methyloprofundus sp.]